MSDNVDGVTTAVLGAVRGQLTARGMMATTVVVLAVTLDENGEEALWSAVDDGTTAWVTLGLLEFAAARERAAAAAADDGRG